MTRRNPFDELEQLFERMSRQVDPGDWRSIGGATVSVDIADHGDALEVLADLPGYERDEIDLALSDGNLRIQAGRKTEDEEAVDEGDVRYLRRERRHEAVSRSVRLPEPVDEEEASARYRNGVLTVRLPKTEPDAGGRQIDIE